MIVDNGKYYLYRHIRNDNNQPFYIGVGTKPPFFSTHITEYRRAFETKQRNDIWNKIVKKYGYTVDILLESDNKDFIAQKEIEFISLYGRMFNGTGILSNLCDGGYNNMSFLTGEYVDRSKRVYTGKSMFLYDNKTGDLIQQFETLLSVCKFTGINNNRMGIFIKKKYNYKNWIFSDTYLGEKVLVSNFLVRIPNGVKREVYKIDTNTNKVIMKYDSIASAARENEITTGSIAMAIKNKRESIGHFWSYTNTTNSVKRKIPSKVYKIKVDSKEVVCEYDSVSLAASVENVSYQSIYEAVTKNSCCNGFYFSFDNTSINKFKKPLAKSVLSIDENCVINNYSKIADAAKELNVNSGRICEAISRKSILSNKRWYYN